MRAGRLAVLLGMALLPAPPGRSQAPPVRPDATTQNAAPSCYRLTVSTRGRPGHGASLDLHTSTHRLIRALDGVLALDESDDWLEVRILALSGSGAINVKAQEAHAELEARTSVSLLGDEARHRELREAAGEEASVAIAPAACAGETVP